MYELLAAGTSPPPAGEERLSAPVAPSLGSFLGPRSSAGESPGTPRGRWSIAADSSAAPFRPAGADLGLSRPLERCGTAGPEEAGDP